jgi:hypothetical protein
VPVVYPLGNNLCRIYLYGRNSENRSQIGFIEVDLTRPRPVKFISSEPVLKLGAPGHFDDSAVMPNWIVKESDIVRLYYNGWNQGVVVPYYSGIGLAVSNDDGMTFERYSKVPIVGRSSVDPLLTHTACVLKDGDTWRMWYSSAVKWTFPAGGGKCYYHIKYAESSDGLSWNPTGKVCIDFVDADEFAIARPCVIKEGGIYKMWYSYSSGKYRIGYAESQDAMNWTRKDSEAGISVSESGWDSEMVEYAFVHNEGGVKYLFYNGNGYGSTGLGYAVLE